MTVQLTAQATVVPRLWTVEEYYRMAETGILRPDEHVELIEGVVLTMPPIGPDHGGHVNRGLRIFGRLLGDRAQLTVQNAVHLRPGSEPEPDLALVRPRADDYIESHPTPSDILLIVEVAVSSLEYDQQVKAKLYAEAGIQDYWIMNLVNQQIEVYRDPSPDGYKLMQIARRGDTLSPVAFPDVTIAVSDFLG